MIPEWVITTIYNYGADYAARGATGLRLDRRAIELTSEEFDAVRAERLRRFADCYLIVGGAAVIMAARASKRRFH